MEKSFAARESHRPVGVTSIVRGVGHQDLANELKERSPDGRVDRRSNMFLAAVLHSEGYSAQVRLRNMSPSGALVEGATVPQPGAAIRLLRGGLSVSGVVVWAVEGRCGVRFRSLVCVREWLGPPHNSEQQRVDDMVRLVKAGAIPLPHPQQGSQERPPAGAAGNPQQLTDELRRVSALLEKLAGTLLSDEATLTKHGEELQHLDLCMQTIGAVLDALAGEGRGASQRLANLRVSCEQALAGYSRDMR